MKNLFKGIVIGIGKILPGVSGAILAILLGVYDKGVYYINNFFNNKRESIKFLLPLGIGIIISIILFSKLISIFLNKYYLYTMMLFIGMIIGCLSEISDKIIKRNYFLIIVGFSLFFLVSIGNINNIYVINNNFFDVIIFFISGICEAIGTVVPGISSAALLMVLGTYNIIIDTLGNIPDIMLNIKVIIPFIMGGFIGILFLVRIIEYFLNNYENNTYNFIFGIVISSIVLLIVQVFKIKYAITELVIGVIFLLMGIFISGIFDK